MSLILALVLWTSACTTPEAVRQFTAAARDATTLFTPVVRDLSGSCIRTHLAERPVAEIADTEPQAAAACKELADLEPKLTGTLKVLTAYLNALSQLASDGLVSYDKEIDGFAGSLQAAGALDAPQVKAVKGLAKFLANAVAAGYQRRHLAKALKDADGDIAVVTEALGKILQTDYDRLLKLEENAQRSRYRDAILNDKNPSTVAQALLQERWRSDLSGFAAKRRAAKDADEILRKIREGHHELAEKVDHWTTAELFKTLGPYTSGIKSLAADFQAAF